MSDFGTRRDKWLDNEFDRLARLRDDCQEAMREIQQEKARRKEAEIERLCAEIDRRATQ